MSPQLFWILMVAALLLVSWRWLRRRSRVREEQLRKVLVEDALKHLHKCEAARSQASLESVSGQLSVSRDRAAELLAEMREQGLVRLDDGLKLTSTGRDYALRVIRAHRLWERYLADETGLPEVDWHGQAEAQEHRLTPEATDALAARLGHPTHDPHGDPVPPSKGAIPRQEGVPLTGLVKGESGRIVHVEDEPASIYGRLVAQGLHVGMEFRMVESNENRLVLRSEGSDRQIDLQAAGNVTVEAVPSPDEEIIAGASRLSQLPQGQTARVVRVSRAARAVERRRFLDLGILPGTSVTAEMAAPGGDPVAYRIRGALIALRSEQADQILVIRGEDAGP